MPPSCAFYVILVYLYPYTLKKPEKVPKNAKLGKTNFNGSSSALTGIVKNW